MTKDELKDGNPAPTPEEGDGRTYSGAAIRGSIWVLLQTGWAKAFMVITQLVLAQLLLPADWGLVGFAVGVAAFLTICGPLPLVDLLVQRGRQLSKALPNAMRICVITAILTAVAIAASSFFIGIRPGEEIRTESGNALSLETPLSDIRADPKLPTLIEHAQGEFTIQIGDAWIATRLPAPEDATTTLGPYLETLEQNINAAAGSNAVGVDLDVENSRVRITMSDGTPARIRSASSSEGSVLDTLGIVYRSLPLMAILFVLATVPLTQAFRAPWDAYMRVKLEFGKLAGTSFITTIVANSVAILLAIIGAGGIAIVSTHTVVPLFAGVCLFLIARPLPRSEKRDHEPIRSLAKDASTLWSAAWVHTAGLRAPLLILGFFMASEEVGFYFFAWTLSVQIVLILSYNLGQTFSPIFSTLQNEPERLAHAYLRSANALAAVTIPLLIAAGSLSPVYVPMLFGAKWTPAIPLLMILMLSQSMASTNATSAFLLKGSGRFRTWLVWQTAQTSLFVIALIIAAKFGSTITVAWVVFGQFVVFAPIGVYLCLRGHGTIRDIIRIYAVPYISCAPFVLVGIGSYMVGASWLALFIWCPLALVVGGGIYILGLRLLDKSRYEEFAEIYTRLREKAAPFVQRFRKKPA